MAKKKAKKKPPDRRNATPGSRPKRPAATSATPGNGERQPGVSRSFARTTAPRELDDPEKRKKWELPPLDQPDKPGPYIIELNVLHVGGIPGAQKAFLDLHRDVVGKDPKEPLEPGEDPKNARSRKPVRIAKSYYRCRLSDHEWRKIVAKDEENPPRQRAIYRLWPDFPVTAQTDRSTITIKADAAVRSFDAVGTGIVWAVVDSGIDGRHPHFMDPDNPKDEKQHTLLSGAVRDLHRSFIDAFEQRGNVQVNFGPLDDPDADENLTRRDELVAKHRQAALSDPFGHGSHVAGIIAGEAPEEAKQRRILERQFKVDTSGSKVSQSFAERQLSPDTKLRGVAPRTRLISLQVLDAQGQGRASQVIQALEYIRERINDNPKLLRVHGINLSVGYDFDPEMFACGQSPLCTAVDRLVQEGVVVVTAAGNSGYGSVAASMSDVKQAGLSNTINDPGNAALAITVGSTHRDSPHLYGVSYFSSKGPTGDGRLKPDLVAPGERITSCAAGSKLMEVAGVTKPDPKLAYYMDDSGTSMAAPHVSGAIAAFLSIRREFIGRPLEVKRIFLESATSLNRERYFEGHGLIDLMRAIQRV
jgi:subtilisin family serine protease